MKYHVVADHPFRQLIERDVLPTPRLISEATRGGVEAYRESEHPHPHGVGMQGLWRVRDDAYDPPGTRYRRVRIEIEHEPLP